MVTDRRMIEALMMAIEPLPNDWEKIRYFWNVALNPELSLGPSGFCELLERALPTTKDRLPFDFCQHFRWCFRDIRQASDCPGIRCLLHGVMLCITNYLTAHKENDSDDVVSLAEFEKIIFLCECLEDTESIGAAKKLLRLFGEIAGIDLVSQILNENSDISDQFKNALAEGAIKRAGPTTVLKIYLRVIANMRPAEINANQIEELKERIRLCCANRSSDSASVLALRSSLIIKLERSMGAQEAYDWFSSEFSDMVVPNT